MRGSYNQSSQEYESVSCTTQHSTISQKLREVGRRIQWTQKFPMRIARII